MSKLPFISQYESPNIVIVPTVSFCNNESPSKRQKLENVSQIVSENIVHHHRPTDKKEQTRPLCAQTLKCSANSVQETPNTIKVSPAKYIVPTQNKMEENQTSPVEDLNKSCVSVEGLNTVQNKSMKSWASSYLMSIGERTYKKPTKFNLSLSRTKECEHKGESVKPLNTHEPINKWISPTNTKSEDSKTLLKINNNIATTEYENDRYTNMLELVNNCMMRECMETNITSTKVILNNKEASKVYNNSTSSSYEYKELILHNPIESANNIRTKIQSQDFNLFSKTAILTNHLRNESNIAMTNKSKNFNIPLPNPIQNSLVHKSTYKLVHKPEDTPKYENDYLDMNLNYKSRPNENKYQIKGDAARSFNNSDAEKKKLKSPKPASNSSCEFETNTPKYVSTKYSDSRNSNQYKGESTNATYSSSKIVKYLSEIPGTSEKKYRERTTSYNFTTATEHSRGLKDNRKLYKSRQENITSTQQPSNRPTLRNRGHSEDVPKSSKMHRKISPDNKKVTIKSNETRKNENEVKYYENEENPYKKTIASVILSNTHKPENKLEIKIDKSQTVKKVKSKTNLKSVLKSSRIFRSSKNKDKLSHDVSKSKPSTIKSVVQVSESFNSKPSDSLKLTQNFDLRTKLSGKPVSLNHYFSKLQKCTKNDTKSIPMKRDNLIITVPNDVEDEDMKKSSDKVTMQIENVPCKQIKFVINFVHKHVSATSNKNSESEDIENENCELKNIDLSFLDDFNVDEIVESLNECQTDSEMKENAKGLVNIDNEHLSEISLNTQIYMEDSDKIKNALDIHDEETMDLTELTENENIIQNQRSCLQEHIENDSTERLSRNHTMSPDIEIIREKPARKVLQLDSNIIVLEDSNDSDVVSLKDKSIVINEPNLEDKLITSHSEQNRDNKKEKEKFSLLETIKTKPNTEESKKENIVTITVEKTENNTQLIDDIKMKPKIREEHMSVVSTEHKTENYASLIDYIKLEDNMVVTISDDEKEYDRPLIDDINIEPKAEENMADTISEVKKMDNMSLIDIKIESSTEVNAIKDLKESLHINYLNNLNNSNTNITEKENVYAENATVIDAVDKSIKSEPIEGNILMHNSTKVVEDISIAISDNEDFSSNLNVDEMFNKTPKNKQLKEPNKALGFKASTIEPDSSSVLPVDPSIHGKLKGEDLEVKMLPPIAHLEGPDKFLVQHLEERPIEHLEGPDKFLVQHLEERMLNFLHDKYTVISYIHRGKFSKIFRCKNSHGQDYVAKVVKSINTRLGVLKENMLKRLQKDIPRDNFNCVFLFNGFGLNKDWCFLTEYYPKNLAQALDKKGQPFHINAVQNLSRQLVAACTALKNNNIVHSDIKPSHILLNSSSTRLKLCGFDAAYYSYVGSVEVLSNIGTVNYRAPELILGYSSDFSIDVWSTALVMFEMATKKQLFPGNYNNDILFKHMCTLGNLPYEMIQRSWFKNAYFRGTVFMRKVGFKGQSITYCENFNRNFRLTETIFLKYNRWNRNKTLEQKKRDYNKLTTFKILLEQMLILHPNQRMPIECVNSNPFIYEKVSDFDD